MRNESNNIESSGNEALNNIIIDNKNKIKSLTKEDEEKINNLFGIEDEIDKNKLNLCYNNKIKKMKLKIN